MLIGSPSFILSIADFAESFSVLGVASVLSRSPHTGAFGCNVRLCFALVPVGDADVGITGVFDQPLSHPMAEIRYPTGNNGGLFVKADGPGSGHDPSDVKPV